MQRGAVLVLAVLGGCGFQIGASGGTTGDDVPGDASGDGQADSAIDAPGTMAQRCTLTLGSDHTCVRRESDQTAWCWGDHAYGELGIGSGSGYSVQPVQVVLGQAAGTLRTKSYHGCAVLADSTVRCWGMNDGNQIGSGLTGTHTTPTTVVGLTDAAEVGVGRSYSCARKTNGTITCWGANSSGQLGDGTIVGKTTPTTTVMGLTAAPVSMAIASGHACVLLPGGIGQCWGGNAYRQLGDGTATDRPTAIAMPLTNLAQIAPSGYSVSGFTGGATCVRKTDDTVWCWGSNDFGQLGDGTTSTTPTGMPAQVVGMTDAAEIVAGRYHVCARRRTGAVACWGRNEFGQLGDGTTSTRSSPTPVTLPRPAIQLGAGGFHTCALLDDYSIRCWGHNGTGQLGDGSTSGRLAPAATGPTLCQ